MANKAVFGIAKSEAQAITIADNLKAAGFSENDVSVLFPDKQGSKDFAHEQHTKAPEGAATGASQWCSPGRSVGWMVGYWGIGDSRARGLYRGRTYHGGLGRRGWRRGGRRTHGSTHRHGYSGV